MMKIFKITRIYTVVASDEAMAKAMVKAPRVSELFVTQETTEELPQFPGTSRWARAWFHELKRQLAG